MTLTQGLQQKLAGLAPFSSGDELVEILDQARQLRCRLVALDSLACAFTRLALRADSLAGMSPERLKKTAEILSARLTYLLEPISPIEIDSQGCVVQMRSNPPQKESDRTTYYELLVSRTGELSLSRYARAAGESRQMIPAHVTREVLSRLVADFSAVAG
jgi:hypothetical protein